MPPKQLLEEQVKRMVKLRMGTLDNLHADGIYSLDEYEAEVKKLDDWAYKQYAKIADQKGHDDHEHQDPKDLCT